jgi:hypothetical protein
VGGSSKAAKASLKAAAAAAEEDLDLDTYEDYDEAEYDEVSGGSAMLFVVGLGTEVLLPFIVSIWQPRVCFVAPA